MKTEVEYQCVENEHKIYLSFDPDRERYSEIFIPMYNRNNEKNGYAIVGFSDLKAALELAGLEIVKKA